MDCGNTLISLTRALISAALSCPVADTTAARTQKNDGSLKIPISSAFSNRDSYVHHVLVEGDRHGVCTYESLGLEIGVTARDKPPLPGSQGMPQRPTCSVTSPENGVKPDLAAENLRKGLLHLCGVFFFLDAYRSSEQIELH